MWNKMRLEKTEKKNVIYATVSLPSGAITRCHLLAKSAVMIAMKSWLCQHAYTL